MSEHDDEAVRERRVLEQIEAALTADDPKLASKFAAAFSGEKRPSVWARLWSLCSAAWAWFVGGIEPSLLWLAKWSFPAMFYSGRDKSQDPPEV